MPMDGGHAEGAGTHSGRHCAGGDIAYFGSRCVQGRVPMVATNMAEPSRAPEVVPPQQLTPRDCSCLVGGEGEGGRLGNMFHGEAERPAPPPWQSTRR